MHYIIWRSIFKIFFKFTCRLKILGAHNIPKKGFFVIASNHVSYLDPILLGVGSPRLDLYYMARHTLFEKPLSRWALKRVHVFPVKKDAPDLGAFKEAIRRLKEGSGLVIFPEGTRSPDGTLRDPEPGIGFLVSKCGAPVIPAYVKGTDKVLPKGRKNIQFSDITVIFGSPIKFSANNGIKETRSNKALYFDIAKRTMEGIRFLSKSYEGNSR